MEKNSVETRIQDNKVIYKRYFDAPVKLVFEAWCDPKHLAEWTPKSLALHTQAVIQGSFILAKASGGSNFAADRIDHLEVYINLLFKK